MNIIGLPVEHLRGEFALFYALAMNAGKTQNSIILLERLRQAGWNVLPFNHLWNTRDGENIVIDERKSQSYPAIRVANVKELEEITFEADERVRYKRAKDISNGETFLFYDAKNDVNGVELTYRNDGIQAVVIDELQLFTLTNEDLQNFLKFIKNCQNKRISVIGNALLYDAKAKYFGCAHELLGQTIYKEELHPVCKAERNGRECGRPALRTQKLWKIEAIEQNLESIFSHTDVQRQDLWNTEICGIKIKEELCELLQQLPILPVYDKKGIRLNSFIPAPYFSLTIEIELDKNVPDNSRKFIYTPVCVECFKLPFEYETQESWQRLVKKATSTTSEISESAAPKTIAIDNVVTAYAISEKRMTKNGSPILSYAPI